MDKPKYAAIIHHRHSIRLPHHDYAQPGGYFITVCIQDRACLLGDIINGEMVLNDTGRMVEKCWGEIPQHFPGVTLDEHTVMPNHFHGIIMIVGAGFSRPVLAGSSRSIFNDGCAEAGNNGHEGREKNGRGNPAPTVGKIIAYFKYQSTRQINIMRNGGLQKLWQRNYYERVIRHEKELFEIRQYIINNPQNWEMDENYRRGGKTVPLRKEIEMKNIFITFLAAVLLLSILPVSQAQEFGKIRALHERATYVSKQKNDFIVRVLTSYKIPHKLNEQGVVVRINMDNKWMDITAIEIVPVLKESADKSQQVAAHELYFFTADGILDVISALTIR